MNVLSDEQRVATAKHRAAMLQARGYILELGYSAATLKAFRVPFVSCDTGVEKSSFGGHLIYQQHWTLPHVHFTLAALPTRYLSRTQIAFNLLERLPETDLAVYTAALRLGAPLEKALDLVTTLTNEERSMIFGGAKP